MYKLFCKNIIPQFENPAFSKSDKEKWIRVFGKVGSDLSRHHEIRKFLSDKLISSDIDFEEEKMIGSILEAILSNCELISKLDSNDKTLNGFLD